MTEKAFAKINLYLDVVGKRDDGYHNIKSVMYSVPFCDEVEVEKDSVLKMTCSEPGLSCGEGNLCIKAAKRFFEVSGIEGGCSIALKKNIPMQAGLGGGSSDAAAVLRALNRLYGFPFDNEGLRKISLRLGADVPFCIEGRPSLVTGIGEVLSDYPALPACGIVICRGTGTVSTPEAYRMIDSTLPGSKSDFERFDSAVRSGELSAIAASMYNRFEDILPSCREIKRLLLDNGAVGALMSGSGSAVFGLFDGSAAACAAADKIPCAVYAGEL